MENQPAKENVRANLQAINACLVILSVKSSEDDTDEDDTLDEISCPPTQVSQNTEVTPLPGLSIVDQKMLKAFGATLTNSDEFDKHDIWVQIWERVVKLNGKLYTIPGGSVGRKIVSI